MGNELRFPLDLITRQVPYKGRMGVKQGVSYNKILLNWIVSKWREWIEVKKTKMEMFYIHSAVAYWTSLKKKRECRPRFYLVLEVAEIRPQYPRSQHPLYLTKC